jgi:hypothetical protein
MPYPELDEARLHHAALRDIFLDRAIGEDPQQFRQVEELCAAAAAAVDDDYCCQQMRKVRAYAAEIFSQAGFRKWSSGSLGDAEFLRRMIVMTLDAFRSQLASIEALRLAGELQQLGLGKASADRTI